MVLSVWPSDHWDLGMFKKILLLKLMVDLSSYVDRAGDNNQMTHFDTSTNSELFVDIL